MSQTHSQSPTTKIQSLHLGQKGWGKVSAHGKGPTSKPAHQQEPSSWALQKRAGNLPSPGSPLWYFSTSCFLSYLGGVKMKIWIYFPKPQHSFGARVGKAKLWFCLHCTSTESSAGLFFIFIFAPEPDYPLWNVPDKATLWLGECHLSIGKKKSLFLIHSYLWLHSWSLYVDR